MFDIRKILLIFAGTICVGLGILGMFLPLMPTTVFLLLAAYCYSRSSEKFHVWLLNNRWCGRYIKSYKEGRGMTARQKASTILILWASIGISILFVWGKFWVTLLLLAIALGVTIHLLWLKTYRPENENADLTAADEIA